MLSAWSMVNQIVPSAAAAIAIGASCGSDMAYSTTRTAGAPPRISSAPATISTTIASAAAIAGGRRHAGIGFAATFNMRVGAWPQRACAPGEA